jgi:hypothetical protein
MTRQEVFDALVQRLIATGEDQATVAEPAQRMVDRWGKVDVDMRDWMDSEVVRLLDKSLGKLTTHDELVSAANKIFATIKLRKELSRGAETPMSKYEENVHAELQDYGKDMETVVAYEAMGIGEAGRADCFAIADVLLRAIARQWRGRRFRPQARRRLEYGATNDPMYPRSIWL